MHRERLHLDPAPHRGERSEFDDETWKWRKGDHDEGRSRDLAFSGVGDVPEKDSCALSSSESRRRDRESAIYLIRIRRL